ncbi:TPA: hypothetical protein MHZ56_18850, partial [Klebsiella variicola]|nr:hypothetical protein [Klebsiella variicola]
MLLNTDVNEWHRQTGASPEAVLRTLSGLQVVQGGCESVAPVSAAPPGRHTGTVAGPLKRKKPIRQDGLF